MPHRRVAIARLIIANEHSWVGNIGDIEALNGVSAFCLSCLCLTVSVLNVAVSKQMHDLYALSFKTFSHTKVLTADGLWSYGEICSYLFSWTLDLNHYSILATSWPRGGICPAYLTKEHWQVQLDPQVKQPELKLFEQIHEDRPVSSRTHLCPCMSTIPNTWFTPFVALSHCTVPPCMPP